MSSVISGFVSRQKREEIIGHLAVGVSAAPCIFALANISAEAQAHSAKRKAPQKEVNPSESPLQVFNPKRFRKKRFEPICLLDEENYSSATTLTVMSAVMSVIRPIVIV